MGLEQIPTCPKGIKHGSHEYANWYDSLTEEGQALVWVNWIEKDVNYLQTLPSIDTDRAIRGIIVGNIGGDAVVNLHGACLLAIAKANARHEMIVNGLKTTWLKTNIAVSKLGHYLPTECQQAYEDLFKEFTPFVEKTLDRSNQLDLEEFNETGQNLYRSLQAISKNPPGMNKTDIQYALDFIIKLKSTNFAPGRR